MKIPAARFLCLAVLTALLASCSIGFPTLIPTPPPLPTATATWTLLPDSSQPLITETPTPTAGAGVTTTASATLEATGTGEPAETTAEAFACPNAPPIRVAVGQKAQVTFTDGLPLRVRSSPEVAEGNVTTQIPEGTLCTITDGPVCADIPGSGADFVFWKIELEDQSARGWVAEGDLENYFIEPAP